MSKIRIRKRGNSYSYSFEISKNPRRMKEKGGFATEDEAFEAGAKAYADWKNGNIGITSERVKLRDYLAAWLENVVRPNVKRMTFKSYCGTVTARIIPHLGDIYVQELHPRDIDRWMQTLAKTGLAHGTLKQTKAVLSIALKYAVYPAELITVNPATGISIPRNAPRKVVMRTIITPEQFAAIPTTSKYYMVFKILYHTGLRISEVLGLTWDNVDLKTGGISVTQQRPQDGYFDTPKTESSIRTFYADTYFLSYLRTLKTTQAANEMRLGEAYQIAYEDVSNGRTLVILPKKLPPSKGYERRPLLCVLSNGIPIKREMLQYSLKRMNLNTHSFRHTHATRLIEAGAKPVDVAARLGHVDAAITQNLYTHDTEDMKQETARIFGEIVGR